MSKEVLISELKDLVAEVNNKATRNMRTSWYDERGKGQLDFALDLQRIIERHQ